MSALLEVRGLVKRFGGLLATDHVDLDVARGEIHALIGPNGAGKTTLVAQLAGQLPPDAGRVHFDGHDITRLAAHQRVRRGMTRSFQMTRLFPSFTVAENVALAMQAASGSSLRAFAPVRRETALFDAAHALLEQLDLEAQADAAIGALSHGARRALEVGLALASRPQLVLLDEPLAGMGPQESQQMERLIASLRGRHTVLLIEHDVAAVFRLADRVSVLVNGAIVASGEPAAVRADPAVVVAYLGDDLGKEVSEADPHRPDHDGAAL